MDLAEIPGQIQATLTLARQVHDSLAEAFLRHGAATTDIERLTKLATTIKLLSSEARAWAKDLSRLAAHTTLEERMNAAFRMVQQLSVADRTAFLRRLASAEADRPDSVQFFKP